MTPLRNLLRGESASTYRVASALFLRLLSVCYLLAFLSLWLQIHGLVGSSGIEPVEPFLSAVRRQLGGQAYRLLPTLCWIDASDAMLHVLCAAGVVASLAAFFRLAPALSLAVAWASYLSLSVAGGVFLQFQWDSLLTEAGFLSIFLAPPGVSRVRAAEPPRLAIFLLWWLLFRLNFASGVVKLASGDPSWRNLTALSYHYETQPLPTWTAWFLHQLPGSFHKASVVFLFIAELAAPFLIFGRRRLRLLACAILGALQLLIAASGNYAFFNLLALSLCVLLIDDARFPRRFKEPGPGASAGLSWPRGVLVPVAVIVLLTTSVELSFQLGAAIPWPRPVIGLVQWLAPFRIANGYGLFAVMTTERPEIVVEGSEDGETWKPYAFRWKPGDAMRRPRFVAPYQPRLDWQMWFAALSRCDDNPWFQNFLERLREGSRPVTSLLESNPFPDRPPRYVRALLYDYRFTDWKTLRTTGAWWRRDLKGVYCGPFPGDVSRRGDRETLEGEALRRLSGAAQDRGRSHTPNRSGSHERPSSEGGAM